jgi:exocyst complex protein 7
MLDHQTAEYLEQIPDVGDAMSSMLITLGDGNWRMGEGMIPGSKTRIEDSDDPERVILEHFTCKPFLHPRIQPK